MARVTTFSRLFPSHHPKAGQPTLFPQKILRSLNPETTYYDCICLSCGWQGVSCCCGGGDPIADTADFADPTCPKCESTKLEDGDLMLGYYNQDKDVWDKKHTIRAGKGCKAGDIFSFRCWSDKPYRSKQIIIAPDQEIVRVVDFEIKGTGYVYIGGKYWGHITHRDIGLLALNDGLLRDDFVSWFDGKTFSGQIRIWKDTELPY